ncbi:alginate O-acetyltransferase AlgX-related protein [Flavobacterium oreochromis]|uniref:AlgX/AlgJ SGNH hydrolase-like domain-containing protein n=1 Tax=Flavobacterium columnare TaxID=996 RepID=A0A246GDI2_9FLAO|nr:hypothetical protein [Flavobacterium oreochromis]OWP79342.1 hypothetical protein BWK62_02240 [Flavobacterium oreochromis]
MKKLIFKTLLFSTPFFVSFIVLKYFYIHYQGDLFRLGYYTHNYNYEWKKLFNSDQYKRKRHFDLVSEIDLSKKHQYDFLAIGDSFTEQGAYSHQDFLAEYTGKKVLQLDRFYHDNPLETVKRLAKGDFFEKIKCKYIILQSVERYITERGYFLADQNKNNINISSLDSINAKREKDKVNEKLNLEYKINFFSKDVIRLPLYNFLYLFSDNAYISKTYHVKTNKSLFSTNNNFCLFYKDDLDFRKKRCDRSAIEQTNKYLNNLSKILNSKNIKLITLISPDKYDIYYPYFQNKDKYPAPIFFNIFNSLPKNYIYLDSKSILKEEINKEKDVYLFDDTHWGALAAKSIALNIKKLLK